MNLSCNTNLPFFLLKIELIKRVWSTRVAHVCHAWSAASGMAPAFNIPNHFWALDRSRPDSTSTVGSSSASSSSACSSLVPSFSLLPSVKSSKADSNLLAGFFITVWDFLGSVCPPLLLLALDFSFFFGGSAVSSPSFFKAEAGLFSLLGDATDLAKALALAFALAFALTTALALAFAFALPVADFSELLAGFFRTSGTSGPSGPSWFSSSGTSWTGLAVAWKASPGGCESSASWFSGWVSGTSSSAMSRTELDAHAIWTTRTAVGVTLWMSWARTRQVQKSGTHGTKITNSKTSFCVKPFASQDQMSKR